jgi:PAS domain S-box-containing protein
MTEARTAARAEGRRGRKWQGPEGPGVRLLSIIAVVGLLVAASVALFVFVWVPKELSEAAVRWQRRLDVVAEDRQTAIANWVGELRSDVRTAASFPTVAEVAGERERGRDADQAAQKHLRSILEKFIESEELVGIMVLDGRGGPVVTAGVPDAWAIGQSAPWRIPDPGRSLVRFVTGPGGLPLVAMATGHSSSSRSAESPGSFVVVAFADPATWLYPFLGRNLLLFRGEEILVFPDAGKTLLGSPSRIPGSKFLEPVTVPDGHTAFAASRKIEGTDWTLHVWFDADEAMGLTRRRVREMALLLLLGILLMTVLTAGLYRETRRRFVKQAEASAQRLALLLDEANDAILSVDAGGRLVDVNRKAEELWGRSRSELLGLTIRGLEPSGEWPALDRHLEEVRKGGHEVFETEYFRKDGSRVPVEVNVCTATVEGKPGYLAIVRDLSARKEAERRYRLISENSVDVIWTIDIASMRFTYVSPSVTRLRGVTPEEAVAQPIEAALTPESAARVKVLLAESLEAVKKGTIPNTSLMLKVDQPRKDGSTVTSEIVATFLLDGRGRPVEILGVTRDISEQLAAEEKVRRSREALIETQRIAHVGSWERDLVTGAVTWSDEVYRIFGLDPAGPRISPERFLSLVHPEDREMVSGLPRAARSGEAARRIDYRIVGPDGAERVVHSVAEPMLGADGSVVRIRGSVADVTERKQQEESLVRLNRELEALASGARELSQARDLASVMGIVGRAARMLKGADGASVVLREGEICFYADEDAIAPLWKGQRFPTSQCLSGWVMEHGQAAVVEDVRTDPRVSAELYANTFVRSVIIVPVGRPEAIGAIGTYWALPRRTDSEELRFLQALADTMAVAIENVQLYADLDRRVRERTAELEQANREMEAFSYSVSHDLRAPLRAIDGFSSLLEQRSAAALGDEGKRLLSVVRANTRKMATLIDDLLAFSRVSRSEIRAGRVSMEALAREAFEEVVPGAPERDRIFLEVGPLPAARGDASLLRLVWSNLIGNAVKFSNGRERAEIRISGEIDGERAVYRVSDNGVGFEMAYADKLFGVFQRLHGVTEFEGTGVGLALVHRIVSRHGGGVSAIGAVGGGATFTFWLPAAE